MKKNQKTSSRGFTIIETLIVLAIVGVIMIVVFLAVPALNRSSHNNQYRTEANNIASAAQEIVANKQGATLAAGDSTAILTASAAKTVTTLTITSTKSPYTPSLTTAVITTGAKCPVIPGTSNTQITPAQGTTSRSATLTYGIEAAGGGTIAQCIQVQ